MQYITNLDRKKLGVYGSKLITEEVILTDERLYEHILLYHKEEYKQLRPYIKSIIENPDYIVEDNRHEDTMIYLKQIDDVGRLFEVDNSAIHTPLKGQKRCRIWHTCQIANR